METVPVNRRIITVLALLITGAGVLFLLQREQITARIGLRPLFYLLADAQRGLERIPLALTRVSAEEENRIGEELARGYRYATPKDDPAQEEIQAALTRMGERLTAGVRRNGIGYRFHYLPEKSLVNAFALPGGQIFVGRGMLELLETEDELAAVLGHEIAHVDRRHCIERMQYELQARKLGLGGFYRLGSIAVRLFQVGYTKDQEFEADRAGLELAVEAGYAPAGALGVRTNFLSLASAPATNRSRRSAKPPRSRSVPGESTSARTRLRGTAGHKWNAKLLPGAGRSSRNRHRSPSRSSRNPRSSG